MKVTAYVGTRTVAKGRRRQTSIIHLILTACISNDLDAVTAAQWKQQVKREKLEERISRPYVSTKTTGIDNDDENL